MPLIRIAIMFWVEYLCPRQGPFWQRSVNPYPSLQSAAIAAQIVKPPLGYARVLDWFGQIVYSL